MALKPANAVPQPPITITNQGNGAQVRLAAAMAIVDVLEHGCSLGPALIHRSTKLIDTRDLALAQEIAYGVLRILPQLRLHIAELVPRNFRPKDFDVECLLLVGLYQIQALRIPHYAGVSQTVAAARLLGKPWASGLINAVLRNFQRKIEEEKHPELVEGRTVRQAHRTVHSYPEWLAARLQRAWPDQAEAIMQASDQRPPMTLRVNLSRITRKDYVEKLITAGFTARPISCAPAALNLDQPIDVTALPGFADGLVSVQDAAAQLAAPLLDIAPNQQILDACAAPGGKMGHILELDATVQLTAVDVDARRTTLLHQNATRLGLNVRIVIADLTTPSTLRLSKGERFDKLTEHNWADRYYDRILLDAPCSAIGVIRRHPDIKWLRRPTDIATLIALQGRILDCVWSQLRPGGILLYVTCSLLPEENQQQILNFLSRTKDAAELPINVTWGSACCVGRQVLPGADGMDGFYFARLVKRNTVNSRL